MSKTAPEIEEERIMIDDNTAPYGAALLRITAGLAFLAHVALKLFVLTPSGTMHYFASMGLPGWFGLFVTAAEILAGWRWFWASTRGWPLS